MMNGYPMSARLPEDLGFGERFWYWRGISGRSFIHSIYSRETCPPLPGAVFIAVRRCGGERQAVAVGRFPTAIEGCSFDIASHAPGALLGDEIHVHLLARDDSAAAGVLSDLQQALDSPGAKPAASSPGLSRPVQLVLIAA